MPSSSFSNILFDTTASNLPLPADFADNHLNSKITNCPIIIQSANGGYSWKLKIKQISDGYCFSDGWSDVVKDSQLCFGDFLLFQPLDQFTFKLSIYGPDCREKIFPPKIGGDGDVDGGVSGEVENVAGEEDNDDGVSGEVEDVAGEEDNDDDDDPFFKAIMTVAHKKFLRLPAEFAESAGIDSEGSMTVKTNDGKEWVTSLKLDKSFRIMKRYLLSAGWPRFRRAYKLSAGDECVFRFIRSEGKLLLSKVTKNKRPVRQPPPSSEFPAKKARKRQDGGGGDVDVGPAEKRREVKKRPLGRGS